MQTKAAVCGNHLNQHGLYLLGNKTAELIKGNLGYNFLPVEILNAVQTRSQIKAAREERGIDSGDAKKGKMRDMEQFVKTCDQCQRAGKPNDKKKAPLKLVPVIQEVFTKLNIDACGPLPITSKGNRYLITAICMSSKFPEAIPVSDISSCSDYRVFERFGILVRHSSVYHPQSNPVEGFHRTVKRLLRVLCLDAGFEWDKHLPSILLALRTVSHESTGYTPSELVYGKNLRTPETLVMEHWMEPEEEGDLVTEYMFKLINRLKRCQEVAINKMEEM
ncbi:retrovirus-related Pol polyprotein from transposon 17.6 [Trichonephila clavipes]|nr:retrovirus-related Pol polyprotein from transposon 17.6 [Trichonephila clavipes]